MPIKNNLKLGNISTTQALFSITSTTPSNKSLLNHKTKRSIYNSDASEFGNRCSICLEYEKYSKEKCIKCINCNSTFHPKCYLDNKISNITSIENLNNFICERCNLNKETYNSIQCFLCGNEKGIMKKFGNGFTHIYCLKLFKELNKDKIEQLRQWRYNYKCKCCKTLIENIPVIKCGNTKCKNYYHIKCAIDLYLIFNINFQKDFYKTDGYVTFHCTTHNVNLVKAYQKFISDNNENDKTNNITENIKVQKINEIPSPIKNMEIEVKKNGNDLINNNMNLKKNESILNENNNLNENLSLKKDDKGEIEKKIFKEEEVSKKESTSIKDYLMEKENNKKISPNNDLKNKQNENKDKKEKDKKNKEEKEIKKVEKKEIEIKKVEFKIQSCDNKINNKNEYNLNKEELNKEKIKDNKSINDEVKSDNQNTNDKTIIENSNEINNNTNEGEKKKKIYYNWHINLGIQNIKPPKKNVNTNIDIFQIFNQLNKNSTLPVYFHNRSYG